MMTTILRLSWHHYQIGLTLESHLCQCSSLSGEVTSFEATLKSKSQFSVDTLYQEDVFGACTVLMV